jgi:hypothetical protein
MATGDDDHRTLVRAYFDAAGGWMEPQDEDRSPPGGDPLYIVWARRRPSPGGR